MMIDKNTLQTLKFMAKAAAGDRKGATALEYALIAGALAAVTLVGFRTFFDRINSFLAGISFTST
jgi:Flp pilus assembly pilin Flp